MQCGWTESKLTLGAAPSKGAVRNSVRSKTDGDFGILSVFLNIPRSVAVPGALARVTLYLVGYFCHRVPKTVESWSQPYRTLPHTPPGVGGCSRILRSLSPNLKSLSLRPEAENFWQFSSWDASKNVIFVRKMCFGTSILLKISRQWRANFWTDQNIRSLSLGRSR